MGDSLLTEIPTNQSNSSGFKGWGLGVARCLRLLYPAAPCFTEAPLAGWDRWAAGSGRDAAAFAVLQPCSEACSVLEGATGFSL